MNPDDYELSDNTQPEGRRGNLLMSMSPDQARAVLERLAEQEPDDALSMLLAQKDQPPA
jgi:hypothetical protein